MHRVSSGARKAKCDVTAEEMPCECELSYQLTLMVRLPKCPCFMVYGEQKNEQNRSLCCRPTKESLNDPEYVNHTLNNLQYPQGITDFVSTSPPVFVKATPNSWAGRFLSFHLKKQTNIKTRAATYFFVVDITNMISPKRGENG